MDIEKAISFFKNSVTRDSGFSPVLIANMDIVIDELEEQSSNRWIPVSERLPTREEYQKNDGRFIVTDGNRVYQSLFDIYKNKFFLSVIYKGNCDFEEIIDSCVVAWQELPGPYKGE